VRTVARLHCKKVEKKLTKWCAISLLLLSFAGFAYARDHVILVIEENRSYSSVYPTGMPWLSQMGDKYGIATNYYSDESGSLLVTCGSPLEAESTFSGAPAAAAQKSSPMTTFSARSTKQAYPGSCMRNRCLMPATWGAATEPMLSGITRRHGIATS
jgi:hypothetical protein